MNKISIIIVFAFIALFFTTSCIVTKKSKALFSTIKVNDNLYFDATEVDVGSWLSYYTWILEHEGYNNAQKVLPDSNVVEPEVWQYIKTKSNVYLNTLGRYTFQPVGFFYDKCSGFIKYNKLLNPVPESCPFLSFPITGISYEQVLNFCIWRTRILGDNTIIYRLPTVEEWTTFALKGLSEYDKKNGFRDSMINQKCPTYNFKTPDTCNIGKFSNAKQNGIGRYPSEQTGAFDVFGNVSEMSSIKGIAKGGNYKLHANQCHPDSIQHYNKPEIWLGFRCIVARNVSGNLNTNAQSSIHENELQKQNVLITNSSNLKANIGNFTDPRDGKTYRTVGIGKQIWLAENLVYKPDSGKYWAYNNEQSNAELYGYLYAWETAKNVCPDGWHLPDKNEFEILLQEIGGSGNTAYNELRPTGSSGLSIINCGLHYGVNFTPITSGCAFWSSTEKNKRNVWGLGVGGLEPIARTYDTYGKNSGLPVRCIKDN